MFLIDILFDRIQMEIFGVQQKQTNLAGISQEEEIGVTVPTDVTRNQRQGYENNMSGKFFIE